MDSPPDLPAAPDPKLTAATLLGLGCGSAALAVGGWIWSKPAASDVLLTLSLVAAALLAIFGLIFAYVGTSAPRPAKLHLLLAFAMNVTALALLITCGAGLAPRLAERIREIQKRTVARDSDDGVAPASKPIAVAAQTETWSEAEAVFHRWAQKKMVDAYETHGKKDERWNEPARALIGKAMRKWVSVEEPLRDRALDDLGRKAVDAGCDDPLVLFLHAAVMGAGDKRTQSLRSAADALSASSYSPALVYLARMQLWQALNVRKAGQEQVQPGLDALKLALAESPMDADDQVVWQFLLTRRASGDFLDAHGEALCEVVDASPLVADWLKHGIRGAVEVELAWEVRGSGWASTVKPAGWRGFEEHLEAASDHLVKSWELNPKHPAAATNMIRVSMGIGNGPAVQMRIWFDRAVAARFDHDPAYNAFLWGMRPRWHGSHEAMLAFGRECLATDRFDTWVPWFLVKATSDIASEWDDPEAFYSEEAPYEDLQKVCEGYIANGSKLGTPAYFQTHLAILAGKCGQWKDCRVELESLKFSLDRTAARFWEEDAKLVVRELSARSGPAAELLVAAEEAAASRKSDVAVEKLRAALAMPGLDPAGRAYFEERLGVFTARHALEESAPRLLFDTLTLTGWENRGVQAKVIEPGVLEIDARRSGVLVSDIVPGATFELTGEIEFAEPPADIAEAQVTLSRVVGSSESAWTIVRFQRDKEDGDVVTLRVEEAERIVRRTILPTQVPFSIAVANGRMQVRVAEEELLDVAMGLPATAAAELRLGVGATARPGDAVIRFRNLQLRSIDGSTPRTRP